MTNTAHIQKTFDFHSGPNSEAIPKTLIVKYFEKTKNYILDYEGENTGFHKGAEPVSLPRSEAEQLLNNFKKNNPPLWLDLSLSDLNKSRDFFLDRLESV
jgi:hypothetical protein